MTITLLNGLGAARGQRSRKGSCASFPTRFIFSLTTKDRPAQLGPSALLAARSSKCIKIDCLPGEVTHGVAPETSCLGVMSRMAIFVTGGCDR